MLQKIIQWCQGRHTLFAIYFAVSGTILQLFHKLDGNFIALIGAVQTFVFAHSVKEDYFDKNSAPDQKGNNGAGQQ